MCVMVGVPGGGSTLVVVRVTGAVCMARINNILILVVCIAIYRLMMANYTTNEGVSFANPYRKHWKGR